MAIDDGYYLSGVQIRLRLSELSRNTPSNYLELRSEYRHLLTIANQGLPEEEGISPRECIEFLEKSYSSEFKKARKETEHRGKHVWITDYYEKKFEEWRRDKE